MPAKGDNCLEFRDIRLLNLDAFIGNAVFVALMTANTLGNKAEEQLLE